MPRHRHPLTLKVILLSGASGTGKSTTAYEVCARLRAAPRKTTHAHIDADNLDALYPRREGAGLMLRGLRALWGVLWTEMSSTLRGGGKGVGDGVPGEEGGLREGQGKEGGRMAVLIISGTAVVLEIERVRRVVEEVVVAAVGDGSTGTQHENVQVEVVPVVLAAEEGLVEGRLRTRVLGEELQEHLDSSRTFRRVLAEWEPDLGGGGGGAGDVGGVRRVDSGRDLEVVVDEVLRVCGL